jgi:hypothetical protein
MQACEKNIQSAAAAEAISVRPQSSRRVLPASAMTWFSFAAATLVTASNGAVSPLYRLYQASMHLTPFWITVVFASYVASLLAALLTVGSLSDHVGRRPVILAALILNVVAMIVFLEARDVGQLILARMVQGLFTGVGATAMGAAILDTDRTRGPLLNSVTAFLGMTLGSLGTTALITFASDPLHRVYEVLLGLTVVMIALLYVMPESSTRKTGALASLRPHVYVAPQSRTIFARLSPANVAGWALGGFYLSLMPTVVATAMGVSSSWVGGTVVGALMLSAAIAIAIFRNRPAQRLVLIGTSTMALGAAVSMIGIQQQQVAALMAGTLIAGAGLGATFSGTLRALLPTAEPHQRAGLLSAFYVQSYLAWSLPALVAGLSAPQIGLATTSYLYGAVIVVLAFISMMASLWTDR